MALNFSIALNVWHGVCGFVCTCGWYGLLMHCVMALAWWCIARAFSAFNHYFIAMRQHHTADFICCLHLNETAKSQMRNKHKMDGHQSATPNASSWILLQDVIDTLPQPCHHFAPTVVPPDPFMLQRLLRRQALWWIKLQQHPDQRLENGKASGSSEKREEKCIDNYLYDIMLPPTSMEVENDHFTKESALRQIHFPLGPAFASSEMCLQSSPFTTPASSKCQSQRSWKCNLLKVVTMTNMAYYFPPIKVQQLTNWPPKLLMLKSEVSTLDLLEDLHSRKNCGNLPLIHFVALRKFLNTVQFTLFLASWSVFP